MVLGITPMSSHARRSPAATAIANMISANKTRDLSGGGEASAVAGAVSRNQKSSHTPRENNPRKVVAYCKTVVIGVQPATGRSIHDRSQAKCSHGQVRAW